jgi:hypothetical protein
MAEEDEDKSPHMDTDETDKEVQDTCPAFDDDLDSEVDDFTIEEDDCVFMAMVHPVDPHHFVCASSTVSGRLAEVFAKNSKLKGFEDIVPTSLHTYTNVFSEMAFDSLPEHHKWDHTIELERKPSLKFHCGERCPSAFNSFELPSWMLYQDVQLLWDSGLVRGESSYSL